MTLALAIDSETTGLEDDSSAVMLEFAMAVVQLEDLSVLYSGSALWPQSRTAAEIYAASSQFIQKFHLDSGLWQDLYQQEQTLVGKQRPGAIDIENGICAVLDHFGIKEGSRTPILGRNPGFDASFLKRSGCDKLLKRLSHQKIDATSYQLICQARYGSDCRYKPPTADGHQRHRALDDCLAAVEEIKHYVTNWMIPVLR